MDILSTYTNIKKPYSKLWYKKSSGEETLVEPAGRVEFYDNKIDRYTLKINDVTKNDSAEYTFAVERLEECSCSYLPGVMLVVTGNSLQKHLSVCSPNYE